MLFTSGSAKNKYSVVGRDHQVAHRAVDRRLALARNIVRKKSGRKEDDQVTHLALEVFPVRVLLVKA